MVIGKVVLGMGLAILAFHSGLHGQNVTVNLNIEHQTIRGFGGMNHPIWQGYDLNASDRDLAFGNGPGQMGLTVLRIWVSPNEADWSRELNTARDVLARGGLVYASAWRAPANIANPFTFQRWGNTVNSFKIPPANYGAYVDHLNRFVEYMQDNGVTLHAIGFQNEPDWADGWTHWTVDEVYNFTRSYAARLRLHGTKVITAESFPYDKAYYDRILRDSVALSNIDIIGAHFYGSNASTANSFFQYPLADQVARHKERWMTEHYTESQGNANMWKGVIVTGDQDQAPRTDSVRALDVAFVIHRGLVEGNFSMYTWWYIRRNYSFIINDTQNNVLPYPATAAEVGRVSKRGFCMAQYAKFVRPGAVRVEATKNPVSEVFVSAFKKADSVVVVVVNRSSQRTLNFNVPGTADITSWRKFTTSATKNVQDDGLITANNGIFTSSFDMESVTTLVGRRLPVIGPSSSSGVSSSSALSSSAGISSSSAEARAPFAGVIQIPGRLEAENYDRGGQGIAFNDTDPQNRGNVYRADAVDIYGSTTTGFQVGYTQTGEWLEYTINVQTAGIYRWNARVSAGADASGFRLLLNGNNISEEINPVNSGTWDTYTLNTGLTTSLPAGQHILRVLVTGSFFNLDWIEFAENTVGIANSIGKDSNHRGYYLVYDIHGRHMGNFQLQNHSSKEQALQATVQKPGIYLLKNSTGVTTSLRVNMP